MKTVTPSTRLVVCVALATLASACMKTQARTPVPVVALDIPTPPARVTIPVQLPEPEPPAPPPPATPAPPARPPRDTSPPRTTTAPTTTAPTPATPPTDTTPAALQTTADVGPLEQKTNSILQEAQLNLDRVKRNELGQQARAQFDSAVSFIKSARSALLVKNYVFAEQLASKALAVAKELVKG